MRIGVCVPAYDGRVHDAHSNAMINMATHCSARGVELVFISCRGCPILTDARNFLVAQALYQGCEKIWFVDSDIAWNECDALFNMLMSPADIIAGAHQARNVHWNDPPRMVVRWAKIPPEQDEETGCWIVDKVATACLVIHRRVFEKLAEMGIADLYIPHGAAEFSDVDHLPYFRNYFDYAKVEFDPPQKLKDELDRIGYKPPYRMNLGEDFYFCHQAQQAGFKCLIDPRVSLVHFDGCVQHNASVEKNVKFEAA